MNDDAPEQLPLVLVFADQEIADAIEPAFAAQGLRVRLADSLPMREQIGSRAPCALVVDGRDRDISAFLTEQKRSWLIGHQVLVLAVVDELPDAEVFAEWLRAGIWDVARLPLDTELLALRIGNVLTGYARRSGDRSQATSLGPYHWSSLVRVTEENLALAGRYARPLSCVAIRLDWKEGSTSQTARETAVRLATAAQDRVRSSDLVGLSRTGVVLVVLPDTDRPGAAVFTGRILQFLEEKLKEWGVLGRLHSSLAVNQNNGPRDGSEFLMGATRGL